MAKKAFKKKQQHSAYVHRQIRAGMVNRAAGGWYVPSSSSMQQVRKSGCLET